MGCGRSLRARHIKRGGPDADGGEVLTWATRRPLPYLVATVLGAATAVGVVAGFAHDHGRAVQERDEAAQGVSTAVTAIVDGLEYRVGSLRALFAASVDVRPAEFRRFTHPLLAGDHASALGWVTVVHERDRAAFERAQGGPIRSVRGGAIADAPIASAYSVVTHTAPDLRGTPTAGIDMSTFSGQGIVMRRAAWSGETQASAPVTLPGIVDRGFVIYAPSYRGGGDPPAGAAARERAIAGYAVGVFRFDELRDALLRGMPAGGALSITTDGSQIVAIGRPGPDAVRRTMNIAGQRWTLAVEPVGHGGIGLGWVAILLGVPLSTLLTLFIRQAVRAEGAARQLARLRQDERDALELANRTLLDHLDELFVMHYDADLRVVRAEGALLLRKGYVPGELVGQLATDLAPSPGPYDELLAALRSACAGEHVSFDLDEPGSGKVLWMQALPLPADATGRCGAMLVALDVTARAVAERARHSAEERFRRSFEDAPVGMALLDGDARYLEVNQALCDILGRGPAELVGRSVSDHTHPDDISGEDHHVAELAAGHVMRISFEKRAVHGAGHSVWVGVHATEIGAGAGEERMYLAQILDVTDQRRFEEQLQHMADHDPLTGLENRRAFERAVEAQLAHVRRYGAEGALLVLDLDDFKAVNDTLGHHTGDELIMSVADVLRAEVRESDRVARLGGDEFAILLPKADETQARAVAQKLVATIREDRRILGGRAWTTTASVGVALFTPTRDTAEQVLVDADLAMYDAKEAGRDGYAIFLPGERAASRTQARLAWMDRIRGALEEDRFTLLAQPILDLGTGRVVHHELLLRMIDPDGDLVPPGSFLAIAERFGLVADIDAWVCRRAIRTLAEHRGHDLTLEVNLSGASIGSPELLETIESEIAAAGVDPRALIFEITETAAVSNIPRARAFADRLNALGCRFALDDFGAGFGSFYYLKHLPFDFLKIDGEFVRHCATSSVDRVIISSLVRVASGLGKRTIAEFVDHQSTIDTLRDLGVDMAQGYTIGRPAPLEHWLAEAGNPAPAPAQW
jgi:diguanylate cyclase (GGDEF)-like protein/PAS domain S-box-containing protein